MRPPRHPSGAATPLTIALSPDGRAKLDELCEREGLSRGEVIERLLAGDSGSHEITLAWWQPKPKATHPPVEAPEPPPKPRDTPKAPAGSREFVEPRFKGSKP